MPSGDNGIELNGSTNRVLKFIANPSKTKIHSEGMGE